MLAILAIAIGLIGAIPATAAPPDGESRLDLAAMHLLPSDLEAAGFHGYGIYYGDRTHGTESSTTGDSGRNVVRDEMLELAR